MNLIQSRQRDRSQHHKRLFSAIFSRPHKRALGDSTSHRQKLEYSGRIQRTLRIDDVLKKIKPSLMSHEGVDRVCNSDYRREILYLVFFNARIDLIAPSEHAAVQVPDVAVAVADQELACALAAATGAANHEHVRVFGDDIEAIPELA